MAASDVQTNILATALQQGGIDARYTESLADIGITSVFNLAAHNVAFGAINSAEATTAIQELLALLHVAAAPDGLAAWPVDGAGEMTHTNRMRAAISAAKLMQAAAANAATGAVVPPAPTATPGGAAFAAAGAAGPAVGAKTDDTLEREGEAIYARTTHILGEVERDSRISYKVVAKLKQGFMSGNMPNLSLEEYTLQVSETAAKTDVVLGDKVYQSKDTAVKKIPIESEEDLMAQMERRATARAHAGSFAVGDIAAAITNGTHPFRSECVPAKQIEVVSSNTHSATVKYVDGAGTAQTIEAFATIRGQRVEVEKMREFYRAHKSVGLHGLRAIDKSIQLQFGNLMMKGFTADAAIHIATLPASYSVGVASASLDDEASAPAPPSGAGGAGQHAGGTGGGVSTPATKGKSPKRERSAEDMLKAAQNERDNLKRQVANLQRGKGNGKDKMRGRNGRDQVRYQRIPNCCGRFNRDWDGCPNPTKGNGTGRTCQLGRHVCEICGGTDHGAVGCPP